MGILERIVRWRTRRYVDSLWRNSRGGYQPSEYKPAPPPPKHPGGIGVAKRHCPGCRCSDA